MKVFLILILSFSFVFTSIAQQIPIAQIDSLLKGTWKSDSTEDMLKFDCSKVDTILGYGMIGSRVMNLYVAFKLIPVFTPYGLCNEWNNGKGYYLKELYDNDPQRSAPGIRQFKIEKISKNQLCLVIIRSHDFPKCTLVEFHRIN